jgi:hypothetical protein
VGRIAYARGTRLDIEPIHYVYSEGWLYGRTSRGAKLDITGESWWPVAFEVDEVDGPFDWRSVVVHGGFYTLRPEERWQQEDYDRALERLRALMPETVRRRRGHGRRLPDRGPGGQRPGQRDPVAPAGGRGTARGRRHGAGLDGAGRE